MIAVRWLITLVFCSALALGLSAPLAAEDMAAAEVQATAKPALTLANIYAQGVDLSRYWVSEKLDGVRAYWDGAHLISRGGHPFRAPEWFTAEFPELPLDGELWMGRGTFERLSGTVRQQEPDPDAWRAVRFMVFDMPAVDAPFAQRLKTMQEVLGACASPYIALIEQFRVADHAALMKRLDVVVRAGGEGLMLHRDAALYRAGRSNDLLKVKRYMDAEARVIKQLPGQGKYAGMLGSLLVEDAQGRRFRLGSGFSDDERRHPPTVGSVVTFKYYGYTKNGTPRFASFLRVRERE